MSLVSFGDLAQSHLLRRHTTEAKSAITQLSQELATGQSADTSRHLSGDLGPVLALDGSLARLEGFASITREMALFAGAMQTGLQVMGDLALEAGNGLIAASGTAATTHIDTAAAAAHSALKSVVSTLNTRFGDRTLFAGADTVGQAMADADVWLASLEASLAGATDLASVEAAVDAWFAAPAGYGSTAYQGGSALAEVPVAAGESVALDITADDPAIRDTLKGLAMAALLDRGAFPGQQGLRQAVAQRAGERLLASETGRAQLAARLGASEAQIETASTRNAAEASSLRIARAEALEIDPYETATRLQDAETQLQLIYTITARISRLSLADYL